MAREVTMGATSVRDGSSGNAQRWAWASASAGALVLAAAICLVFGPENPLVDSRATGMSLPLRYGLRAVAVGLLFVGAACWTRARR